MASRSSFDPVGSSRSFVQSVFTAVEGRQHLQVIPPQVGGVPQIDLHEVIKPPASASQGRAETDSEAFSTDLRP